MIGLVVQELNITERDPSYFNPYRSAAHVSKDEDIVKKKKKSTKREKRKKGPQIAKIELWASSSPPRDSSDRFLSRLVDW